TRARTRLGRVVLVTQRGGHSAVFAGPCARSHVSVRESRVCDSALSPTDGKPGGRGRQDGCEEGRPGRPPASYSMASGGRDGKDGRAVRRPRSQRQRGARRTVGG